jgi:hypothetical protein
MDLSDCLQPPADSFQFRRDFKGLLLLIAQGAEYVVDQFTGIAAVARADLLREKILNVFGQCDCHARNYRGLIGLTSCVWESVAHYRLQQNYR